jgi:hypothetical protein
MSKIYFIVQWLSSTLLTAQTGLMKYENEESTSKINVMMMKSSSRCSAAARQMWCFYVDHPPLLRNWKVKQLNNFFVGGKIIGVPSCAGFFGPSKSCFQVIRVVRTETEIWFFWKKISSEKIVKKLREN